MVIIGRSPNDKLCAATDRLRGHGTCSRPPPPFHHHAASLPAPRDAYRLRSSGDFPSPYLMQRLLLIVLTLFLFGEHCAAEDPAYRRSIASPDQQYSLVFSDNQNFIIQDSRGAAVFLSRDLPRFPGLAGIRREHVLWSPDSQILAIAGGGGHDLETFVLVRRGNTFTPAMVPRVTGIRDNPYITPLKWLKGRRLVLGISGPHAGKAIGYTYKGRATIRVSITPPACEVLYKKITGHDDAKDAK